MTAPEEIIQLYKTINKLDSKLDKLTNKKISLENQINTIVDSKIYKTWQFINKLKKKFFQREYKANKYYVKKISTKEIKEKISIIIPTRNGGSEFKDNLSLIKSQKNIPNKEIIVLDNNSSDKTKYFAKKMGCTIYKIPENKFGHGKTRKFGASKANGKYLIFTVQDGKINDPYCYCKLINFMKLNKLSAASGIQKPYEHADSFSSWQNSNHYKTMNSDNSSFFYKGNDFPKDVFSKLEFIEKRKLLCIDDVLACYDKKIFNYTNFSTSIKFAEDSELAKNIILNGDRIGLTSKSIIYHSHNISVLYAFKRSFVDTFSIKKIFNVVMSRINSTEKTDYQITTILLLLSTLIEPKFNPITINQIEKYIYLNKVSKSNEVLHIIKKLYPRLNVSKYMLDKKMLLSINYYSNPLLKEYESYSKIIKKTPLYGKFWANFFGSYLAEIVLKSKDNKLFDKLNHILEVRV